MSINDQIPNYDEWKTRSPYEPGEVYGPDEHDYEPDLDEDRLDTNEIVNEDLLDDGEEEEDVPF